MIVITESDVLLFELLASRSWLLVPYSQFDQQLISE